MSDTTYRGSTATLPGTTTFTKAWVRPPGADRHQLTHAVDAGLRIALCGISTGTRGGPWPLDATLWDSALGRCPVCARVVHGSADGRG